MADDPNNLVLELLRNMRADLATIRREVHDTRLQIREHTTWLSKLDQGQGLILQMVQRLSERLDRTEVRLELRETP